MEYSRTYAKHIQKYPECPENTKNARKILNNIWKMSKNMSDKMENRGKDGQASNPAYDLQKIKCYSKNVRLGLKTLIMVSLWPENLSQPKFLDEPKNQQF